MVTKYYDKPKKILHTGYWRASEASETLSGLFNRESRIYYIYIVRANFVLITRKEGGFEIAARTLCLRVRRYASLYSSGKNPAFQATFQF